MILNKFILFLKCFNGIGDASIRKLINNNCIKDVNFKNSKDIINWFRNNSNYFSKKVDVSAINVDKIEEARNKRHEIENELAQINASYITYFDANYPKQFKNMQDYPVILFYKGNIKLLNENKICAIIGTREPSLKTIEYGKKIGAFMTKLGYVIVSGLALGCDTIGHQSSLDNQGKTIAIMGTGIDYIYPSANIELANNIVLNDGLLITEELPGFKGASYSFVQRDRLQAALANIVIALETGSTGGTMYASRAATEKYNKTLAVLDPEIIPNGNISGNVELINYYKANTIKQISDINNFI